MYDLPGSCARCPRVLTGPPRKELEASREWVAEGPLDPGSRDCLGRKGGVGSCGGRGAAQNCPLVNCLGPADCKSLGVGECPEEGSVRPGLFTQQLPALQLPESALGVPTPQNRKGAERWE